MDRLPIPAKLDDKSRLKVPIGRQMAEASGSKAVRSLLIIALAYRLAWPTGVLIALAAGWLSIEQLESLKPLFVGE